MNSAGPLPSFNVCCKHNIFLSSNRKLNIYIFVYLLVHFFPYFLFSPLQNETTCIRFSPSIRHVMIELVCFIWSDVDTHKPVILHQIHLCIPNMPPSSRTVKYPHLYALSGPDSEESCDPDSSSAESNRIKLLSL